MANLADGPALARLLESSAQRQQRAIGRFASHNEVQAYSLEINKAKASRRVKTAPSNMLTADVDPMSYAQKYLRTIISDLAAQHLQTSRMLLRNFEWLLPGPETTPEQLLIYDQMATSAMTVTNEEIGQILSLELSTPTSPPLPPGDHFYFRSWEFTIAQMQSLLDTFERNEDRSAETEEWQKLLDLHRPTDRSHEDDDRPPTKLTIRYWGTVSGPKRPIDRYIEDITQRKNGILIMFIRAVQEACPEVAESAQVYHVLHASLPPDSYLDKDDVERVLIQFGHHTSSLNRQRGGFYGSYVPSSDDADIFREMKTDFWHGFKKDAVAPSDHVAAQVAGHFREVQQYANDHPDEAGTGFYHFTDDLRNVVRREATPRMYQGETVMLFIGKDITYEQYMNPKPFISGQSRAGHITREFVGRLVRWEAQAHQRAVYPESFDPSMDGPWLFADLWPWLAHKNHPQAMKFLQEYLKHTSPIVVASYSRLVNDITLADFKHANGVKLYAFTPYIGVATLQYSEFHPETQQPMEESAFINIPHIHPGFDKYGSQTPELRRMLDFTMQYTFLFGHVTLQVLDENAAADFEPTRKQLCESILERVSKLCANSRPHKQFYDTFQTVRDELMVYWRNQAAKKMQMTGTPLDAQPALTATSREKMASLGRAEGEPHSPLRMKQLQDLWLKNMPDLHTFIEHEDQNRDAWVQSMGAALRGQYYYVYLLSMKAPDSSTPAFLDEFKPQWAEGEDWMSNPQARREAAASAGLWIGKQREKDTATEEVEEDKPEDFLSAYDCQGRSMKFDSSGGFAIRWISDRGVRKTARHTSKHAAPTTAAGRYLFCTPFGVDILGPNQVAFRQKHFGGQTSPATISVKMLFKYPDLQALWIAICKAHGIDTSAFEVFEDDAVEWGTKAGVKMLSSHARSETPKQNHPPRRLDANWLLQDFLLQSDHLADGGHFRTASKDKFPDSTEDLQNFVKFIKRPEYRKHPYAKDWLGALDIDKPVMGWLGKNLPMLRNSRTVNQQEKSKGLRVQTMNYSQPSSKGVHVHETYYILGAPGSAVSDPFADGSDQSCISEESKKKKRKAEKEAAKEQNDGDNDDDDDDEGPPTKKTAKPAKPSAKSTRKRQPSINKDDDDDEDDDPPTKKGAQPVKTPAKGEAKGMFDDDDDDDGDEGPATKKTAKRAKASAGDKRKRSGADDDDDDDDDDGRLPFTQASSKRSRNLGPVRQDRQMTLRGEGESDYGRAVDLEQEELRTMFNADPRRAFEASLERMKASRGRGGRGGQGR